MVAKLTHVNADDVVNKYRAGISVKDIARDLCVDVSIIYDRIHSVGAIRDWRKHLDPDTVVALYAEGRGAKEIGRMFGATDYPVKTILKSRGIRIRGRVEQMQLARNKIVPDIVAMNDAGMLASAIAIQTNMTVSNVLDIMGANGITPNSRLIDIPIADIIAKHDAGETVAGIAKGFGVADNVIVRIMKQNGVTRRRSKSENARYSATLAGFCMDEAVAMFDSGIGVRGIAERFNVPVSTVSSFFKGSGIQTLNRSQQQFARMARATPEERAATTRAANIAATGRVVSMETKLLSARTNQQRQSKRMSVTEFDLARMLADRGIATSQQTAIGPYNCDLTTDSVAVEVWGGYWHFYGEHARRNEERFRYILNAGWNVIILGVISRYPVTEAVADYVVAEIQRLRRNPPELREYRMIWGAGDFTSGGSLNDEKLSFVRPLVRPRNLPLN